MRPSSATLIEPSAAKCQQTAALSVGVDRLSFSDVVDVARAGRAVAPLAPEVAAKLEVSLVRRELGASVEQT
jgi:hypothetical protein